MGPPTGAVKVTVTMRLMESTEIRGLPYRAAASIALKPPSPSVGAMKLMVSAVVGAAGDNTNEDGGDDGGAPRRCHSTIAAGAVVQATPRIAAHSKRSAA